MNKVCIVLVLSFLLAKSAHGQVIISLIFGEALNSDKVEFGLVGGLNQSYFLNMKESERLNNFNLGFYFHINLKNQSYLSTGVLVKSNVGASGMPVYSTGDPDFDDIYKDGERITTINYFYVPIMWHQRFNNRWYLEGGVQAGLQHGAKDIFETQFQGNDLEYTINTRDQYYPLDFGFVGGAGYKFKKQIKSMAAGVLYYYGIVDVARDKSLTINNSSLYFYLKIPIGANGKKKKE